MKNMVWFLVFGALVVLPSCMFSREKTVEQQLAHSGELVFDLYDIIKDESDQKGKNIFFSATSIKQAMALLCDGARGTTQQELARVLNLSVDNHTRHNEVKRIQVLFNQKNKSYELLMTNALWIGTPGEILPFYRSLVRQVYGAEIQEVDFLKKPKESLAQINGWVNTQTHGMIPTILSSVEPQTRLVITNAVYFKGDWKHPFDEKLTTHESFFVDDKKAVIVPTMHKTENCLYAQTPSVHMIGLPYKGDDLVAYIVMPKDKKTLGNWFDNQVFRELKENAVTQKVAISVPRLKIAAEYKDVVRYFEKLGVHKLFLAPFAGKGADLSGIDGKRDLFVSLIIHKAALSFDEKGTTAAAATAIVLMKSSFNPEPVVEFKVDHQYVIIIQDIKSHEIIFMGHIVNPTAL